MNELDENIIENLKQIKFFFDDGIISEKEYSILKAEILSPKSEENPSLHLKENFKNKKGVLTLKFDGQWFLFDTKTKLFVNNQLHSTLSTKNGFRVEIPLNSNSITIKLLLSGIKSTEFEIEELVKGKKYSMDLAYDTIGGRYSSKYKFSENG